MTNDGSDSCLKIIVAMMATTFDITYDEASSLL